MDRFHVFKRRGCCALHSLHIRKKALHPRRRHIAIFIRVHRKFVL